MSAHQGNLAVIPARAGSKRLPGKNILTFCGRPLIEWTIEAAKHARAIERVVVTTDCQKIASVAERAGAEVPFLRPPQYATDDATSLDVLSHAVTAIWAEIHHFDGVVLLQPTSPRRTSVQLDDAFQMFLGQRPDSVISITPSESAEGCTGFVDDNSLMSGFPLEGPRPSDLNKDLFRLNGAIYLTAIDRFSGPQLNDWGATRLGYWMKAEDSIDIDSFEDFVEAEKMMQRRLATTN